MSITRKYNNKTKAWEVVAASDASSISVRDQQLVEDGQVETNVSSVLQRMDNDIKTLKGNVSWLAEHGGGGSGSGSGGSVLAEIKVNGKASGSSIVLDKTGLSIQVQSSNSKLKWSINANGAQIVLKSASGTTSTQIEYDDIQNAGITKTFQLSVVAFNEDTLTNVYWDGTIQIATVDISTTSEISYNFVDISKPSAQIIYSCTVGVLGQYFLYINDTRIGDIISFSDKKKDIVVQISDLVSKYGMTFNVGSNTVKAMLQSATDQDIKSQTITSAVLLIADQPVISCSQFSISPDNRSNVYINIGSQTVVQTPYTVYYKNGFYKAQVYTNYGEKKSWDSISTFNSYNQYYENASCTLPAGIAIGANVQITIAVFDGGANTEYSQTYYCITTEPDYGLLTVPDAVFSFRTLYGAIIDNQWSDPNATLYIKNENVKSREIQVGQSKSLRLQNASYAMIKNNGSQSFYRDYITDLIPEFTLSICYKCDFHPDDDRTVLSFAKCNTQYTPNQGILIRDHKLYVAQNTFDLQDNELMSIAITFQALTSAGVGNVLLYINGVVESVFENMSISSIIPADAEYMTVGAQIENDQEMFYTDMNVFRVSMYNKCLSPLNVLYEFLNDQACANIKNGNPDTDKISDGLKRNFISVTDDGNRSLLYNDSMTFSNNEQDFSQFFSINNLVSVAGGLQLKEEMKNMIIPIPIMTIDVSNSDIWTWSNFIQANNNLGDSYTACTFQYYDQTATNDNIISGSCSVKVQGTSTLSDVIKNLSIKFDDDSIFVPKETWFPEQVYTLKADIVDSSHSLNASIGRFVNEEFGMRYNQDGSLKSTDSWYPFSDTVKNEYIKAKSSGTVFNKYFPKATLKHGVEGFPVFVIINFKSTSSTTTSVHSLGIYQFILGRESPRNLGYEIIDSITFGNGDPQLIYPMYAQNVTITTKTNMGYWFEANQNDSFGQDLGFQEADKLTDKKLTGIFWQNDRDYYDSTIQIKYNNLGSAAVSQPSDFAPLRQFIQNIIHLPVTNRRYSIFGSQYLVRNTFANHTYPVYTSYMTSSSGRQWKEAAGQVNTMYSTSGDDLNTTVDNLNLRSYAKYFVIAMLFGLIDNFEKNMPLKFYWKKDKDGKYQYKDGQPEYEIPILGIYDTDTGLGGDNQGLLDVKETVWLSTLENVGGALVETSKTDQSNITNIIGQNNKLWYFDSGEVNYAIGGSKDGSLYADSWIQMLRQIHNNNMPLQVDYDLQDIVNVYYNNYFLKQTNGCGELLFNLTYFSKYLNKYVSNGNIVNQANKLHGRRQQQIRRWLQKRVVFLDSMFQAMGTYQENQIISPSTVSITSGQAPQFKITANNPIITKVSHQSQDNCQYLIMDTNDKMDIYWGASEPATQAVNHTVSQSDSIQALGDEGMSLSDIYFVKINNGTLPYLTNFDAHNCQALGADDNALTKFKKAGAVSQLREIDLSNTSKANGNEINYNLDLSEGFEKLQKLNLYNSCVTTIRLPKGQNSIPLMQFDIRGCQLTSLELSDQNLLDSLDLTGCDRLSQLQISSCNNLRTLNLDETQSSLDSVNIASDTFQSINCIGNDSVRTVQIQSSMLESVVFQNCLKLQSATIICNNLQTLDFSGCTRLTEITLVSSQDTIVKIDLSNTSVQVFRASTTDTETNEIDLSRFKQISNFNIKNNSKVKYIRFRNDESQPIVITNRFQNSGLLRVYGHIKLNIENAFNGCTKFSILGPEMMYDGISMVADDGRVKHFTEVASAIENNRPKFQTVDNATNITYGVASIYGNFLSTSCTILDVYYALYNVTTAQSHAGSMFQGCRKVQFSFTEKCNNSPHRKMFVNCYSLKDINGMFFSSGSHDFVIYSPSHDINGNITADDGLFSPLKNVEQIYNLFRCAFAMDRFMIRTTGWNYKIKNMDFTYGPIVDDVSKLTKYPDNQYMLDNIQTAGNLNKFFFNVPNLQYLRHVFTDTFIINYDLTDDLCCPATSIAKSLTSTYATGTIDIGKLFVNKKFVQQISGSCHSSGGNYSEQIHKDLPKATFVIKNGMFDDMPYLERIGSNMLIGDYASSPSAASFNGSEIERSFGDQSFPYELFKNQKKLLGAESFFRDVQQGELSNAVVELPGTLFNNCPKLQNIQAMFMNIGIDFKLSSNSFSKCPKLSNVSELFSECGTHFHGSIPVRFFYHGEKLASMTYTGANLWNDDQTDYKYNPFDRVLQDDGTIVERGIDDADLQTITITYRSCNANIVDVSNAFKNCRIEPYQNENPEIEVNADYMPFTHIISNGRVQTATYNNKEKTFIWYYDGVNIPDGYNGENLDEEHDSTRIGEVNFAEGQNETCTMFFAFPPDLLRYCTPNISTSLSLFEDCGYTTNNTGTIYLTPSFADYPDYGLHGRIVPYMLKPVSGAKDITGMFKNCKLLSYYTTETGINYIIPKTFFKYAPNIQTMIQAFQGITIPANVDLNVFGYMKQALNIYKLFYLSRWNGTSLAPITVNGIFKNKQILDLYRAFSVNDNDYRISLTPLHRTGYVVFDNVFTSNKIAKLKDQYVFDGFNKNTVKFQNKTLSQDNVEADTRYNYRTSG